MDSAGITSSRVADTPFAVIDFETTGLRAGADRVVEVSVVRIEPRQPPRLVLDTLINPQRTMAATEIHGICDQDVADAPSFREIATDVANAIEGSVVASYNVYFDVPFLRYELESSGIEGEAPHLCIMYLRPMLGMGKRCGLDDACSCHNVSRSATHMASADALAAAQIMAMGIKRMDEMGVKTFAELRQLKDYKFTSSFNLPPLPRVGTSVLCGKMKSRARFGQPAVAAAPTKNPIAVYWDAMAAVLSDLVITDEEVASLEGKKRELGLSIAQVRALHARAFSHVINQFIDDRSLDENECRKLQLLYGCLQKLGWAPGQPLL